MHLGEKNKMQEEEKVRLEKINGKYRMKNLTSWKWLIGEETEDGRRR